MQTFFKYPYSDIDFSFTKKKKQNKINKNGQNNFEDWNIWRVCYFFFRNIFSVTKLIDELLSDLVQLGNLISGQKLIETFQFSNNY